AENDGFGASVAIDGDTLVAGAPGDDNGANENQGSDYVFTRSGTDFTLQQKLMASDGKASDAFGVSVAIDGDTLVAGAPIAPLVDGTPIPPPPARADQGAAYVFTRSGPNWTGEEELTAASDGAGGKFFGFSVSFDGDSLVAGAPGDDNGANINQGAAFVFVPCPTITVNPATLPTGTVGAAFSQTLTATGGTTPFTFSFSGALPPGL